MLIMSDQWMIYKTNQNEANWTFEVAFNLRLMEIPFELEKILKCGRVDIAITKDDMLFGIIEVKRKAHSEYSDQLLRYMNAGVQVHLTWPGDNVIKLCLRAKRWLNHKGVKLDTSAITRKRKNREIYSKVLADIVAGKGSNIYDHLSAKAQKSSS